MAKPSLICCADDRQLRAALATFAPRGGYELVPTAWPALRSCLGPNDLVLIDLDAVPVRELVRWARQRSATHSVPTIMLASRLTSAALSRVRQACPEALFLKPLASHDELVQAIGAAFRKLARWQRAIHQSRDRHLLGVSS